MRQAPKLNLTTAPAVEPVVAADLAAWLGASATDPLLTPLATSARQVCEQHLGISLITQIHDQYFDLVGAVPGEWWDGVREGPITEVHQLPSVFKLARRPLVTVDSVKFYDEADAETIADPLTYYIVKHDRPPFVTLRSGYAWPSMVHRIRDSVIIKMTTGFGAIAADVPEALKSGIKALAAYFFEHRGACDSDEAIVNSGAAEFWKTYRAMKT